MSLARGFSSSSIRRTNVQKPLSQQHTSGFGRLRSNRIGGFALHSRQINLPKLPLGPMPEKTQDISVDSIANEIERLVTEWNILKTTKDPATSKYPNFSTAARNIINDCVEVLESIERSSWYRADNPFAQDQLEHIHSELKKNKSTLSHKELEVVELMVKKAQFVFDLWERVHFACSVLNDMYNRYHNQGEVVDESAAMKEVYEEYKDIYNLLQESKDVIVWTRPTKFKQEDIDSILNEEEKQRLKDYDDDVLAKVRYHLQLRAFDEFELVSQRVNELLNRLEYFRGQSGIGFKGMDRDVFK